MTDGRSFLIDTNIFIPLEDPNVVPEELAALIRSSSEHGVKIYVHEASRTDLNRDPRQERKAVTLSKLAVTHLPAAFFISA